MATKKTSQTKTKVKRDSVKSLRTKIDLLEKDIVKLPNNFLTEFKIYVLQIETEFQNVEVLLEHIQSLIHSS